MSSESKPDVTTEPAEATPAPAPQQQQQQQPPPLPPLDPPPPEAAVPLTDDGGVFKLMLTTDDSADADGATVTDGGGTEDAVEEFSPCPGDQVTVHWVGRYHGGERHGEQFGSTRDPNSDGPGQPVSFKLDDGQSLRAIERCLPTMRRGQLCRIFARADYANDNDDGDAEAAAASACAHGHKPAPPSVVQAPSHANVTIDLELVDWRGEDISFDKDCGMLRSRVRPGEGLVNPSMASRVTIQMRGRLADAPGTEFLPTRRFEYELGDGISLPSSDGICQGVEAVIFRMHKGEQIRVWLAPRLGYGASGCPELAVPSDARLLYELELLDFVKPREVWELTRQEKLTEAEAAKARGLACLAAGNLRLAHAHCKRVVDYLEWDADFRDAADLQTTRRRMLTGGRLNLALVCLKLGKYQQAGAQCTSVIEQLNSQSEKAYYRRGLSRLSACNYEQAMADFTACLELNPTNSAARAGAAKCLAGARAVAERERRLYAGMFDRFAKLDAKGKVGGDQSRADFPIDTWDNRLADGMLSIPQELEAFGEEMPQKKRSGSGGAGSGSGATAAAASATAKTEEATIVEVDEEK